VASGHALTSVAQQRVLLAPVEPGAGAEALGQAQQGGEQGGHDLEVAGQERLAVLVRQG
jgi:hypothetical protein